jgi:transcriptional regulator with XRE-family HTH domain
MANGDPAPTPVTSRRELARILRSLRQQHGYSLENVNEHTNVSPSFLSRVERGIRGIGDDKVEALCVLYRTPHALRDEIRQLATVGRLPSWWDDAAFPRSVHEYIGVEQVATAITSYGSIIPGLLQTEAYAAAIVEGTDLDRVPSIHDTAVSHRLRRQDVLRRPDPPWLRIVLDESALRREVGGVRTTQDQMARLMAAAARPRISIQIIPFSSGAHPGMDSRFTILSTSEEHTAELVHVEGLSGYRNLERPKDLGRFEQAWRDLSAKALPPNESVRMIATIARSS